MCIYFNTCWKFQRQYQELFEVRISSFKKNNNKNTKSIMTGELCTLVASEPAAGQDVWSLPLLFRTLYRLHIQVSRGFLTDVNRRAACRRIGTRHLQLQQNSDVVHARRPPVGGSWAERLLHQVLLLLLDLHHVLLHWILHNELQYQTKKKAVSSSFPCVSCRSSVLWLQFWTC